MDSEDDDPQKVYVRWIWYWLMDPEDDDPQKVYVPDLILADGSRR